MFPVCVLAYGRLCNTLLRDGLDSLSWSDREDKGVGFEIYKKISK